jgi:TonB-linked SusC/RagA family outer membrane protein
VFNINQITDKQKLKLLTKRVFMKKKLLMLFLGMFLLSIQIMAQQITVTGKVKSADDGLPIPGATVKIKGSSVTTQTGTDGIYSIKANPGQTIEFSYIGYSTLEKVVGTDKSIDVSLKEDSKQLSEVVVTGALGIKTSKRELGASQQTISGREVAQTQRENFINSLQGRIAGVDVTSTSGVPGASSSITIRGVSSIGGSSQPLFVIDGLPVDNSTTSTGIFATSSTFENRGVDFTNRASDFSPEDIEDITVLKGPEAAALYGIDAANGAIIITTRRGKTGEGRVSYSNNFRIDEVTNAPEVQRVYSLGASGIAGASAVSYWGPKYRPDVQLYDNITGFFQTAITQKHNVGFEGGTEKGNYRVTGTYTAQKGVVPNTGYDRFTLFGATQSQVNNWLKADATFTFSNNSNDQVFKGEGGPLLSLLSWPATDDAKNYLSNAGTRRLLNIDGELDNPYFNVNKNYNKTKTNRLYTTTGLTISLMKGLKFDAKGGYDVYTTQIQILRHPESNYGRTKGGLLDEAVINQNNFNANAYFTYNTKFGKKIGFNAMLGSSLLNNKTENRASSAESFIDPNFVSLNNSPSASRFTKATSYNKRLIGAYGRLSVDYDKLLYLTVTGRNDWSSTLPVKNQSFFYPSVSTSFIFSDLKGLEGIKKVLNMGKLRASIAQVGRDATAYRVYPAYEYKEVIGGGYGYGNYGPNLDLLPEKATSYEIGTELSFLKGRLGIDFAYYNKVTDNQIVPNIRSSYGTGFILAEMNGGKVRNWGYEAMITAKPIVTNNFTWNIIGNFSASRSRLLALPASLPESYNSDTWFYGNLRGASVVGQPLTGLTSPFWLRNKGGELIINPSSGLPINSVDFVSNGSDRWPDWTFGLTNNFSYKNFNLSFLLDFRKGGDVLNATEHWLTVKGMTKRTLDREEPRIIKGVLQDGLENSANPTQNNITVIPYFLNGYYTTISPEQFIEKDVNYIRMRDITLSYALPSKLLARQKLFKSASVFTTITDLFIITNYSGLDPVSNGNNAATLGAGGIGMDFGNFATPTGFSFGLRIGL